MNSQDKSSYPGLDHLKGERAPAELHSRIMLALQPEQRQAKTAKALKLSVAAAFALALVSISVFAPRITFAASIRRILKAFQAIHQYHIRSFKVVDGRRQLVSETWVNGDKRRYQRYDSDGKPLPNFPGFADMAAKLDKKLQGMTPQQLQDPGLKDQLNKEIATLGPGSGFISERITIDGQEVTDLPEAAKQAIRIQMFQSGPMFSIGGQEDITYILGILKDSSLWDAQTDQSINGKAATRLTVKGGDRDASLLIDSHTSLPIAIQMKDLQSGEPIIDEIDYPAAGP